MHAFYKWPPACAAFTSTLPAPQKPASSLPHSAWNRIADTRERRHLEADQRHTRTMASGSGSPTHTNDGVWKRSPTHALERISQLASARFGSCSAKSNPTPTSPRRQSQSPIANRQSPIAQRALNGGGHY